MPCLNTEQNSGFSVEAPRGRDPAAALQLKENGMVGQPESGNYGATDWLAKATPEHLITQGAAIFSKISQMDTQTQDRFVQQLKGDPTAQRLFERIAAATA